MTDTHASYFLAGICGAGMSSLAFLLQSRGEHVRGSDIVCTGPEAERLIAEGIPVLTEQDGAVSLSGDDIIVRSSAIHQDNPVFLAAKRAGLSIRHRTDVLAELVSEYDLIAVAGTHGKTTTSGMIGYVLAEAGYEPTIYVGGKILGFTRYFPATKNSRKLVGGRPLMVMETDESDASFLKFHADVAVITNIDRDHLGTYEGSFTNLVRAFRQFAKQCDKRRGVVIGCGDDPNVRGIVQCLNHHASYGYTRKNDIRIAYDVASNSVHIVTAEAGYSFHMARGDEKSYLNAIAAALACHFIGIPFSTALSTLSRFPGMERRMQVLAEYQGITLLSDHADHPTEIRATLQAVAARYPRRRLFLVLQPHRFSRVQNCLSAYAPALDGVKHLALLDIFPAGESCDHAVALNQALRADIHDRLGGALLPGLPIDELFTRLRTLLRSGDVILFMGPGDVNRLAARFSSLLTSNIEVQ